MTITQQTYEIEIDKQELNTIQECIEILDKIEDTMRKYNCTTLNAFEDGSISIGEISCTRVNLEDLEYIFRYVKAME